MKVRTQDLSELIATDRRDVVSLTLDVDPTRPEHQSPSPAYRIWARHALHQAAAAAPKAVRDDLDEIAHRIDMRLHQPINGRGVVILAAPGQWYERATPDPLPNRIEYGRPDTLPILWADREYRPWIVVLNGTAHAKIVAVSPSVTTVVHEETLDVDTSQWRFKAGRPPVSTKRVGIGAARGVQRDTFDARMDEQVHRFWHATAQRVAQEAAALSIDRVVIAGPERAAYGLLERLPEASRALVAGLLHIPSHTAVEEFAVRSLPVIVTQAQRQATQLVAELAAGAEVNAAVLGRAATVEAIARGEIMTIVAARDLDGTIGECPNCGYVASASDAACPTCGTMMERMPLRQILPVLARRDGAEIVVLRPTACVGLPDGLGGRLRYATGRAS